MKWSPSYITTFSVTCNLPVPNVIGLNEKVIICPFFATPLIVASVLETSVFSNSKSLVFITGDLLSGIESNFSLYKSISVPAACLFCPFEEITSNPIYLPFCTSSKEV